MALSIDEYGLIKVTHDKLIDVPFDVIQDSKTKLYGIMSCLGHTIYPCCFDAIYFYRRPNIAFCIDLIEFIKDGKKSVSTISNMFKKVPIRDRDLLGVREVRRCKITNRFYLCSEYFLGYNSRYIDYFPNGYIVTIPNDYRCLLGPDDSIIPSEKDAQFINVYMTDLRNKTEMRIVNIRALYAYTKGSVCKTFNAVIHNTIRDINNVNKAFDAIAGKPFRVIKADKLSESRLDFI